MSDVFIESHKCNCRHRHIDWISFAFNGSLLLSIETVPVLKKLKLNWSRHFERLNRIMRRSRDLSASHSFCTSLTKSCSSSASHHSKIHYYKIMSFIIKTSSLFRPSLTSRVLRPVCTSTKSPLTGPPYLSFPSSPKVQRNQRFTPNTRHITTTTIKMSQSNRAFHLSSVFNVKGKVCDIITRSLDASHC